MIGELKPYPAYKAFGVQWLREVPKHWETYRAKRLFRKMERSVKDSDEVVTCFRDGVVTLRKNRRVRGFTESLKEIGYQGVLRSDLVIHSMDAFAGAAGVSDSDGKATSVYSVCVPLIECVNPYYYAFCVREMARSEWILALTKGIRERSTDFRFTVFASQIVPLPPLTEQIAIVRFLDHADRRIQRYIRAKQMRITLLEEQKQAIIHQAVTGQIDVGTGLPYPTYKASGVEWLGKVPEHWEVKRFKSLVKHIDQGVSPQAENYLADGTAWGVLKAGCVNRGVFREREHKRLAFDYAFDPILAVAVGDVLVSRASGSPHLVGSVGRVSSVKYNLILSDKTFRPVFNQDIDPDFMVLAMNGRYYRDQVERAISGAEGLANNLPLSSLRAFFFVVPSSDEQHKIVGYVRRWINKLSGAVAYAERETLLLREYRARLVADVVTGKLDVREAAAALPEVDPLAAEDHLDDTAEATDQPAFDHEEEVVELEY